MKSNIIPIKERQSFRQYLENAFSFNSYVAESVLDSINYDKVIYDNIIKYGKVYSVSKDIINKENNSLQIITITPDTFEGTKREDCATLRKLIDLLATERILFNEHLIKIDELERKITLIKSKYELTI